MALTSDGSSRRFCFGPRSVAWPVALDAAVAHCVGSLESAAPVPPPQRTKLLNETLASIGEDMEQLPKRPWEYPRP